MKLKKKLIINADDFGFNQAISDGIVECFTRGCLTSTTLMAHMPAAEYAVELAKDLPDLSVGVHLSLCTGRPVAPASQIPSLTMEDGSFLPAPEMMRRAQRGKLLVKDIEIEFSAQVERLIELGISPSHLDSHHNIGVYPQPFFALLRVAKKYNIRRMRTYRGWFRVPEGERMGGLQLAKANIKRAPKHLFYEAMHLYCRVNGFDMPNEKFGFHRVLGDKPAEIDLAGFERLVKALPSGCSELVAHPSLPFSDPEMDRPEYTARRVQEYTLYADPRTLDICSDAGVELVSYREV